MTDAPVSEGAHADAGAPDAMTAAEVDACAASADAAAEVNAGASADAAAGPVDVAGSAGNTAGSAASPVGPAGNLEPADVARLVREAVRDEFDDVLPHVVRALKRDQAFDALSERLRSAEDRLEARRDRPIAVALLRVLHRLRHLKVDKAVRDSLELEIVKILNTAGFQEFGAVGEPFTPARHEPLEGKTAAGTGIVAEVYASGLNSFGDVVVRAQVRLAPEARQVTRDAVRPGPHPLSSARSEES